LARNKIPTGRLNVPDEDFYESPEDLKALYQYRLSRFGHSTNPLVVAWMEELRLEVEAADWLTGDGSL
jgi:hypothetical protein